jgi:glycine/serine hydroxymethyltransferase
LIDYDQLEENAMLFKPAMVIAGGSAHLVITIKALP